MLLRRKEEVGKVKGIRFPPQGPVALLGKARAEQAECPSPPHPRAGELREDL